MNQNEIYFRDLECPLFASDNESAESAENCSNVENNDTSAQNETVTKRKRRRVPTIQSELGQPHPFYQCIAPLRCLLLRDVEPQKWAAIQQMMDHVEVYIKYPSFNFFLLLVCYSLCY